MPPRTQYTKNMLPIPEECKRTLDDWRRIYSGHATTPFAHVASNAAPAAPPSSSSSGSIAAPVNTLKRSAPRSDMPIIKNARRGGAAQALEAMQSAGIQSLTDDLLRDREAASGVGSTKSHIATWTKFHDKVYGTTAGCGVTPVLPLMPNQVVAVAALFKAGDYRSYANYWASMKSRHLDEGFA